MTEQVASTGRAGIVVSAGAGLAILLAVAAGSRAEAQTNVVPSAQALPPVECTTQGATTYCKDGTQFQQNQAVTPGSEAAAEGKPLAQRVGKSGPTEYQRDNLRIFGVDDRIRRLGESNYNTGQQGTQGVNNSGRNCARFSTSVVCD